MSVFARACVHVCGRVFWYACAWGVWGRLAVQRSKSFIHYAALFFVIPGVAYAVRPFFLGKPVDPEQLKVRLYAEMS